MSKAPALREKIRSELLDRVMHHELPPSSRIRETALASELGASRTPLREALFSLVQDGFIDATRDRGFSVKPLTAREVREIYPIVWTLEILALQTSRGNFTAIIPDLVQLNRKLRRAVHKPTLAIRYDTLWHSKLTSLCPNERLISIVSTLKRLIYRYEFIYMNNPDLIASSVEQHKQIIGALTERSVKTATVLLEKNWRWAMQNLLDQFDWTS
jgi:DNA-binding GntR family transcriptional regulator